MKILIFVISLKSLFPENLSRLFFSKQIPPKHTIIILFGDQKKKKRKHIKKAAAHAAVGTIATKSPSAHLSESS